MIAKTPGGQALYSQIAEHMRTDLMTLKYGEKIPTESEFMERYSASRGTIRQALHILELAGEIYRVQGVGTFKGEGYPDATVLSRIPTLTNSLTRQWKSSTISEKKLELIKAEEKLCEMLECEAGTELWKLSRIRGTEENPNTAYCVGYILRESIPDLKVTDLEMSIIHMICVKFGIVFSHSRNTVKIGYMDKEICDKFGVSENHPVLCTTLVAYDLEGKAFFTDFTYNFDPAYEYTFNCEYTWNEL